MHVIFSCENTQYMWWQAELLHYTYEKVGMQDRLTALVSATDEQPRKFSCSCFEVANFQGCVESGIFKPLNKPGAVTQWLGSSQPEDETIFLIDPDSAFTGIVPDPGHLPKGQAFADSHTYMDVRLPANQTVLSRHCRREALARVQPVGIYIIINKSDLAAVAPRWFQKTIEIRNDEICRRALPDDGWISDMWGYAIAAAELGIEHQIANYSQMTGSNCLRYPIIHYCLPVIEELEWWDRNRAQTVLWSKLDYRPWDVPSLEKVRTAEGKALFRNLAEMATLE
jgi:hypothetical protein